MSRAIRHRWFARPLVLGIAVLLMLFAATAYLGFRYWHEQEVASVAVQHSRQVLETLDRLRADIADLEAERRGYLLTLDPEYLKPYGVSDVRVRRESESLQTLVAKDPLQSLRASHLGLTVATKLREMDDIFKMARASGTDAALATISNLDEIRSQIDQMVDHERFLLANWEARVEALEQDKTWVIAAAVIIITALAAGASALARLEATRRRRTTEENVRLQSNLKLREARMRQLVDADLIGIIIWDISGQIFEANDAFLRMVGYEREDLVSGRVNRADLTPPEWRDRDARSIAELRMTRRLQPFEKEFLRKDGSRVPVLIGGTMFEESENEGFGFVLDLTERKRVAEALREVQMELAHASRVATMGQLTASIAHEVSQPIAAAVTNAQAALRFLSAQPPDLEEVEQALAAIANDGTRAGDVVGRIRALIKKSPPRKESVDINEAIREVIEVTRSEAVKTGVSVRAELADSLSRIEGDRVQLQQVVLNLAVNAIQAMGAVADGVRDLLIITAQVAPNVVLVAVKDSGPGLAPESVERIFDPFYSTKPGGLGMGLSICRSIIEAHEGQLWVTANQARGTTFSFTVPMRPRSPIEPGRRFSEAEIIAPS